MKIIFALLVIIGGAAIYLSYLRPSKENPRDAWIQKADTTVVDVNAKTPEEVLNAFDQFDFKSERAARARLGQDSSVDPAFGFGAFGDERFMHIIPHETNDIEVLYVKTIKNSSTSPKQAYLGNHLTREQLSIIIRGYFTNDEQAILQFCKRQPDDFFKQVAPQL